MAAIRSGIPTTFRSANFRSRLEARWAAFFDLIGWPWIYEPLDAEGYIPDFLIPGKDPIFVEVGPCITPEDYAEKARKADERAHLLRHDVLVVGVSPISPLATSHWTYLQPGVTAGRFGEFFPENEQDSACYAWAAGVWAGPESRLQVFHDEMSYGRRPFGGGDPSHPDYYVSIDRIDRLWREAGNAVQWRAAG